MNDNVISLVPSARDDLRAAVAKLCPIFGIPDDAQDQLLDCLAHLDAKRFNIPYTDGEALAVMRPYGRELRAVVASPDLDAERLYCLDHVTCDEAGMLELFDRFGIMGAFKALDPGSGRETEGFNVAGLPTRIAPLAPEHALPMMREALATFLNDVTGMRASSRGDFKRGKTKLEVVPGRMADFIQRCLRLAGWDFTAKEINGNYKVVLMKREWVRHPRSKPRKRGAG